MMAKMRVVEITSSEAVEERVYAAALMYANARNAGEGRADRPDCGSSLFAQWFLVSNVPFEYIGDMYNRFYEMRETSQAERISKKRWHTPIILVKQTRSQRLHYAREKAEMFRAASRVKSVG